MFAAFVFGFVIVGLVFHVDTDSITSGIGDIEGREEILNFLAQPNALHLSERQTREALASAEYQLELAEADKAEQGYDYYTSFISGTDYVYVYRSQIALYNYMIDNGLFDTDVYLYDSSLFSLGFFTGGSATAFAVSMLGVFAFLLSIYALIIGSGAYASEMRNGTLKLVLLNPITRNQLTLAKLLAMLTILAGAVLTVFLCVTAYSYIAYNEPGQRLLYIFNASTVFEASGSFPLFLEAMSLFINTFCFGIMAFFFGTVTKKRTVGFVLPYAIELCAALVGMVGLGRFWITNVMSFSNFFGISSGLYTGSDFFISLPLFIAYFGSMIALSFIVFNRRDVA
jgi:ABC-2 type transport system permease protein